MDEHVVVLDILEQIEAERNNLQQRGIALAQEKDEHLDSGDPIPSRLSFNLLALLKDTIEHDINRRAHLTPAQRRSNLGNIAITAHLLISLIDIERYSNPQQGYSGGNVWRMLRFLHKFDIGSQNALANPAYQISDADVQALLDNDIQNIFLLIVIAEKNALRHQNPGWSPVLLPPAPNHDFIQARNQARQQYRNHRLFVNLDRIITPARELEQLRKAIQSFQAIFYAEANLNNPNPVIRRRAKKSILLSLIVIGEAVTQKNLTLPTAAVVQAQLVNSGWRRLFIQLANRIAHSKWDIHLQRIPDCIANLDFQPITQQLHTILPLFEAMLHHITQAGAAGTLQAHYAQNIALPAGAIPWPPGPLNNLFNSLASEDTYNADHALPANHNEFTSQAMLVCIRDEVAQINEIYANPPQHPAEIELAAKVIRFHLCRVAQFFEQIDHNNDIQIETLLEDNLAAQYRAFRNYMRHGDDLMEISTISPWVFLNQYSVLLNAYVIPRLDQALNPAAPGHGGP